MARWLASEAGTALVAVISTERSELDMRPIIRRWFTRSTSAAALPATVVKMVRSTA